jgi:hypothetical protein
MRKPTKPAEWVRIPKWCVNKGCRRRATSAKMMSDFWIALCDICQKKQITIDVNKTMEEKPGGFTPGER